MAVMEAADLQYRDDAALRGRGDLAMDRRVLV